MPFEGMNFGLARPTVQIENPMDVAMKGLAMQGQQQQQQMGAIQLQNAQLDQQDMQKVRSLAQTGQYQTPDALADAAMQAGVSPKTVLAMKMQGADYQAKVAQTAQSLATAAQRGGAAQVEKIGLIAKQAQDARTLAMTAKDPQTWTDGLNALDQKYASAGVPSLAQKYGDFTPQNVNMLALNGATMADAHAAVFGQNMSGPAGITNIKTPLTPGSAPVATQLMAGQPHPGVGPDGKPGFFQLDAQGKVPDGWKPMPNASMTVQMPQGVSPAAQQGKTGQEVIDSLPPATAGVVQAILDGRQSPPSGFAQKTPYWQGIMQNVYAADPQWSEQRAQVRKAFTTGTDGKNIGALNTATVHLDAYLEAAQALQNGTFTPGNAIYNKVSAILGQPAPTSFEAIKNAVAGEQAAALKGSATDIEIHNIAQTMNNSNSPAQFLDSGKAALGVMRQKLNTYQERYAQQNPGDTLYSPVLPSASNVFNKYGISGGVPSAGATGSPSSSQPATMVKPGTKTTYYLHSDGNYYLAPPK